MRRNIFPGGHVDSFPGNANKVLHWTWTTTGMALLRLDKKNPKNTVYMPCFFQHRREGACRLFPRTLTAGISYHAGRVVGGKLLVCSPRSGYLSLTGRYSLSPEGPQS
jgi:hypothetical protein